MVADGRGVGVKNRENLPTSQMDGPLLYSNLFEELKMNYKAILIQFAAILSLTTVAVECQSKHTIFNQLFGYQILQVRDIHALRCNSYKTSIYTTF